MLGFGCKTRQATLTALMLDVFGHVIAASSGNCRRTNRCRISNHPSYNPSSKLLKQDLKMISAVDTNVCYVILGPQHIKITFDR